MRNLLNTKLQNNFSLRTKFTLTFLAITLIPLGLLAYLRDRATKAALTDSANNALFSVASQTSSSIDTFINNNLETIRIEAQLSLFQEFLTLQTKNGVDTNLKTEVIELLYNLQDLHNQDQPSEQTYLLGYSLLDRSGTILIDTHTPLSEPNPNIGSDWSNRSYYLQPALTGIPFVSAFEISSNQTDPPSLYFASRISNESKQPIGVLVAHYSGLILQDLIAEKNNLAGKGSFGVLFDENLIHLAHGTNPEVIFKTVAPIEETILKQLQQSKRLPEVPTSELFLNFPDLEENLTNTTNQPFFEAKDIATGDLINQVAVARLESQPWIVAFFQPKEIFLAPAIQQTNNTLILGAVISILTIIASIIASRNLMSPITRLTEVTEQIVAGNLNVEAPVLSGDEIGVLAKSFNTMTNQLRETLSGLEKKVEERTEQIKASAEVGQAASSVLDPDELIFKVVNLITDRFGHYYAAIFLTDEFGDWAELVDATGEAGKILKEHKHRLKIGGQSMVGEAVRTRQARIALDVGQEAIRFNNPVLPNTRSEIALPLIVGKRAIGALDVQSIEESAFEEQDIETFQNMANQVAAAIENARLFQELQNRLGEISRLSQIFLQEGWQSVAKTRQDAIVYVDDHVQRSKTLSIPHLESAIHDKKPAIYLEKGTACATIPLILREQVIGILKLKSSNLTWNEDDLAIIETVSKQAALALENARLIQDTISRAQQEQMISKVSSQMRETLDVETILQTAVREMRGILNLSEVEVTITPNPTSGSEPN